MNRCALRWLGIAMLTVAIGGTPATTQAGASSDSLLELASGRGPSVGFGFGVSPLHWDVIAPPAPLPGATAAEGTMLSDPEPRSRAVSLDIKLRWPGTEPTTRLEPYVVFGPALFLDPSPDAVSLAGIHPDPAPRLGARAGAGFNLRVSKDATLFGAYDISTDLGGVTSPGAKALGASGIDGYDVLYGVRFRY